MRNLATIALVPLAIVTTSARADFTVANIEFNGLIRLSADSLYRVVAVESGDIATDSNIAKSIKALYETGNFLDIKAKKVGNNLVFDVVERPVIADVSFEGNKLIPKEALQEGLKQIGISSGNVLKQATLEQIQNELKQQYNQQGYYNSDVTVTRTDLGNNRVALKFNFVEGKPARVVEISVFGNQQFSDEAIKDAMNIKETSWKNIISKSDRYAKEKLNASLESVTAMYQNAGYVKFNIENAVLNISPEKDKVYIEISVDEGDKYQFGQVNFLGKPNYELDKLKQQVTFEAGEQYSQRQITKTLQNFNVLYGNDGYYFAQIRPVPRIDDEKRVVDMDFFIDPVRPVYVRRINFTGNTKTADEVLRREMRQLEGALASNEKIELSRARLMRTGFFKTVNVEVKPIDNTPDQVDVNIAVEEQPSGSSTIAAGYSQSGGLTFQAGLSQSNFMGTGNRVNLQLSRSETLDNYSIGVTNPYFTPDGISQSANVYWRKTKYDDKNISNYVTDSLGGTLGYSYPIDENKSLSASISADKTTIKGGRNLAVANYKYLADKGRLSTTLLGGKIPSFAASFKTYNLNLGWGMNTLDRGQFPTKGMSHNVDLSLAFGDTAYQRLVYQGNYYYPFVKNTVLRGYTKLGYGNNLPFWENFYAGGYGSVRGYENYTLGPSSNRYQFASNDKYPEEIGGNALAQVGAELILPMPFKGDWASQVRPVLFLEGAQVFDTTDRHKQTVTVDGKTVPLLNKKDNDMRFSAGVGATWVTPIGPISLSYAKPLNKKDGDKIDQVQFEIGRLF
ncbi:surface antigen (D15) [Moraxella macacae 0408225]|uniref:Outer membrane protein assembly factor BamA n=1 Tax=Moraxella macacae 0408225 TaxID=1230338 RepID=L2F631_9GAMM|nr:outer membrane protein assembly factor BamA [Moraxella macacae]ELA08236.1 surface antigen (D15) [Moraxella macacae 0408225]